METDYRIITLADAPIAERQRLVSAIKLLFQPLGWKGADRQKWGALADPANIQPAFGAIPLTWVALASTEVIGSVSIVLRDRPDLDLDPWVAGLVVREDLRKRGIGTKLLHCTQNYATALADASGYPSTERRLYLDTERLHQECQPEWYEARGWQFFDPGEKTARLKIVMYKDI